MHRKFNSRWGALGTFPYADLTDGATLETLSGRQLDVTRDGDAVTVGGALIVGSDIPASNGLIHVPQALILP